MMAQVEKAPQLQALDELRGDVRSPEDQAVLDGWEREMVAGRERIGVVATDPGADPALSAPKERQVDEQGLVLIPSDQRSAEDNVYPNGRR